MNEVEVKVNVFDLQGDDANALITWAIFWSPFDYPNKWVLRKFFAQNDGTVRPDVGAWICPSLESARELIPPGCARFLPNALKDHQCLIEAWI